MQIGDTLGAAVDHGTGPIAGASSKSWMRAVLAAELEEVEDEILKAAAAKASPALRGYEP